MDLTEHQSEAVERLASFHHARFVGAAGTGKSTVSIHLPRLLDWSDATVFVTPTHAARAVLEAKAEAAGVEIEVRTVHSLIYKPPRVVHCPSCPISSRQSDDPERPSCAHLAPGATCPDAHDERLGCGGLSFRGTEPRRFWEDYDNVIVDESSMLSPDLFARLEAGGPAHGLLRNLIYVGDHCQLPPVLDREARAALLTDGYVGDDWSCLSSVPMAQAKLTEVMRQDQGGVLTGAVALRDLIDPPEGAPQAGGAAGHWITRHLLDRAGPVDGTVAPWHATYLAPFVSAMSADPRKRAVLVATHKQRVAWNSAARSALGYPRESPIVGDVVMATRNMAALGVTKWQRATVVGLKPRDGGHCILKHPCSNDQCWEATVTVGDGERVADFIDGVHLALPTLYEERPTVRHAPWVWGYAMTVNVSQGSQFEAVAYQQHSYDLYATARAAYTAVTRAERYVAIA